MEKKKVLVLFGGMSTEHEVSRVSATSVLQNINKDKYNIGVIGIDKDGNELTFLDLLFEEEDFVYEKVEKSILKERLMRELEAGLTEREFQVLCLRFGLKGGVPMAQREVAQLMKISRSYISRIEKKAIEKLRARIKKQDFYD